MIDRFNEIPIPAHLDMLFFSAFHEYAIIGGMPQVVQRYLSTGTFIGINAVYEEIWNTYKDDIEKYGKNNTEKRY